ncbi:hypothetical protein ABTX35_00750 [Streptomyces sp. NPDC096080]|uniref:hypothetical protein n=1 Tax=Streptomyces sp. NPDC096080 TaxID=3156693 RepID=UPI003321485F
MAELKDAIGEILPFGVLLLPQSLRRRGHAWHTCVCTPTQVVGLSLWGVALWVDVLGLQAWIPLTELAVIDHQRAPDHGRLVLRGARHDVTIRYPAGAARAVIGFTAAVRSLLRGRTRPVPGARLKAPAAMRRWRHVLDDKGCADADFAAAETLLPGWWHRHRSWRGLVGITPQEVLVALPAGRDVRAPDMPYVPRARLTRMSCAGRTLRLETNGLLVDVELGKRPARQAAHHPSLATASARTQADETPRTALG